MFDKKKVYSVQNRSGGSVIYKIDDLNVRREFASGEVKNLTGEELERLLYTPGGANIINKYLLIHSKEALDALGLSVEPEYKLDKRGVADLLTKGSVDQLIDCINFAPEGVLELIKAVSVELPLNDLNKCQVIKDMMGYDVLFVVNTNKQIAAESGISETAAPAKKRRVAPKTTEEEAPKAAPKRKRRVANPEYSEAE